MELGGTLLLLLAFGGCQSADSSKDKNALAATTRAVPVAVVAAVEQDMPVYLTGLGSVTAYNTVSVKSRVDGQLMQVNFKEGQQVNKGRSADPDRSTSLPGATGVGAGAVV